MKFPESHRVQPPGYESAPGDTFGFFVLLDGADRLFCIATDGAPVPGLDIPPWEHVSVTVRNRRGVPLLRCPTWEQMCKAKAAFWSEDEAVMQIHPPRADYVNHHPYCLHLWRPVGQTIPLPPSILVGPRA
jgi:hypothetical protein